ncbi:hypothetical protein Taro_016424 [Colocasia esculenta]|uniref:Retrotransposon gag domain-containing protein n=1 Tax=Colocasia esculenta TaxID=4460 RepID=A0A843UQ49_COLES|nr:hypothetical protein [Colocasia esculenta]
MIEKSLQDNVDRWTSIIKSTAISVDVYVLTDQSAAAWCAMPLIGDANHPNGYPDLPTDLCVAMASRGRRGGVPARDDEQRREERAEQQAPAQQGLVLPPPPPVDYGVFMQGLVQAMQTQAHTQAALQAQLEAQERADVWWASLLRTRFEDGQIDVAWDEFVRLFRAKFVPEHIQDRMEQEFLSSTLCKGKIHFEENQI